MSVWTEKYRPACLADMKGHRKIKELLTRSIKTKCVGLPPLILYGPPGTGKTSLAMALAKETYPDISPSLFTMYLNASDERSIEVIRERILQFTQTKWPGIERKFVMFDEVETMTEPAQASLRSLLDEVDQEGHGSTPLFLFLCNSLYRIHPSIRSRCVALFCAHVPLVHVKETLKMIQRAEGVAPSAVKVPSDITFALQRGDLRSFVTAIQYGTELNPWDAWFARLEASRVGKSVYIWDDGLKKAPFCVLIRHVFLWLQTFRGGIYFKKPEFASFVGACLELQDAPMTTLLERIPAAWEKFYLCESAK
jgi:DNA polymerase III delta prime subunit